MFEDPTLVIETATAACSVALFRDLRVLGEIHADIGRGHAERLIGAIAELPDRGRAAQIVVSCGPGSFTGVRVGVAAARALGLGWGVAVSGYSTLDVIAAQAFATDAAEAVTVVMHGGHGEAFMQRFVREPFTATNAIVSVPLADAGAQIATSDVIVGTAAAEVAATRADVRIVAYQLRATSAHLLPRPQFFSPAAPIYGRGADAQPMAS